jgi:hypothetical protein
MDMTPRELEEYRALRETIRERGTARVWIFVAGIAAWAALVLATSVLAAAPSTTLVPLVLLAAAFEAVFALHMGVERIGRYLQVFHEASEERAAWERTAMSIGPLPGVSGTDPLFLACFAIAGTLNFAPVLVAGPVAVEVIVIGAAHLLFLVRLAVARRAAAGGRAGDLARFQQIKDRAT